MLFEFGSEPDHLSGRVINTHKNGAAFGVEKSDDGLQEDPFGLLVLDWQVVLFVLDVDAFGRERLTEFKVAFAVDAVWLLLLHTNDGLNKFL